MDWAGTLANAHPFWLENPGKAEAQKSLDQVRYRPSHHGYPRLLTSDIDNDGKEDLVINNFLPDKGLADSIAWFSIPKNPRSADQWERHIFALGDARGGSHYMGAGDIDGDGWKEIAVGAKGKPFADGNWFAFWTNPGKDGVKGKERRSSRKISSRLPTSCLPT